MMHDVQTMTGRKHWHGTLFPFAAKCRVLVSPVGLDTFEFASSCTSSEQVGLLFAEDRSWLALAESS